MPNTSTRPCHQPEANTLPHAPASADNPELTFKTLVPYSFNRADHSKNIADRMLDRVWSAQGSIPTLCPPYCAITQSISSMNEKELIQVGLGQNIQDLRVTWAKHDKTHPDCIASSQSWFSFVFCPPQKGTSFGSIMFKDF